MITRFEWDPAKAASNLRKHRVSFDTAIRAFADPFAFTEQDQHTRAANSAGRPSAWWRAMSLLLVAHTIHEEDEDGQYREIITYHLRKADRKEAPIKQEIR